MQPLLRSRTLLLALWFTALAACPPSNPGNDASDTNDATSDVATDAPATDANDAGPVGAACGRELGPCNPVENTGCGAGEACLVGANQEQTALVSICGMVNPMKPPRASTTREIGQARKRPFAGSGGLCRTMIDNLRS